MRHTILLVFTQFIFHFGNYFVLEADIEDVGDRRSSPTFEVPGSEYVVVPKSDLAPNQLKSQRFLDVIRLDPKEIDLAMLVRLCRARLGLDILDVASKTGVSRQLIGRIERGEHLPSKGIVEKLSSLFGKEFFDYVIEQNFVETKPKD